MKWTSFPIFLSLYYFLPLSHSLAPSLFSLSLSRSSLISLSSLESCRQIEEGSFTRSDCTSADSSDAGAGAGRNGGEILMLCERSLYVLKVLGPSHTLHSLPPLLSFLFIPSLSFLVIPSPSIPFSLLSLLRALCRCPLSVLCVSALCRRPVSMLCVGALCQCLAPCVGALCRCSVSVLCVGAV